MNTHDLSGEILLVNPNKSQGVRMRSSLMKRFPTAKVDVVASFPTAVKRLHDKNYHLVLSDALIKNMDVSDVVAGIKKAAPDAGLIAMTERGNDTVGPEAIECGADDYISKARDSIKDLPQMAEKVLLKNKASHKSEFASVPITFLRRISLELDQVLARSNLIAKSPTNAHIINGIQDRVDKLKKLAQKVLPSLPS
jgi:DNA-binding NtrC family response regulator